MRKILKVGKIIKKWQERRVICPKCGCIFLYEDKDVIYFGSYNDVKIYCPHCKYTIDIGDLYYEQIMKCGVK